MTLSEQTAALKRAAQDAGFRLVGVCPAIEARSFDRLEAWLAEGRAGQMDYLAKRFAAYRHPENVLPGARSLLMLGLPYRPDLAAAQRDSDDRVREARAGEGRVSSYAWSGVDYHDLIHDRLQQLTQAAEQILPGVRTRGLVDTAPLLERDFAQLAGLGWIGKNTMLIDRQYGSWFFLAALLLDCELAYDAPHVTNHCGTCTACLDACPTRAFPEPYKLDASRCISYLTIELRGDVPEPLRPAIGDWLFGCDVCQDVCPWNRKAMAGDTAFTPSPHFNPIALTQLFELDDDSFRARFRGTSLWRTRRRGLLRNAAIVLGNQADPASAPALLRGTRDAEPEVRAACEWALSRLSTNHAAPPPNPPDGGLE
jgi:epoxyqueuosine reductase